MPLILEFTAAEFNLAPEKLRSPRLWPCPDQDAISARLVGMALCSQFLRDLHPDHMRETFGATPQLARYARTWLRDQTNPTLKARGQRIRGAVQRALDDLKQSLEQPAANAPAAP